MQLFSRIERLECRIPSRLRAAPNVKDRMQAVIATPNPQPVFRPTNRLERLITAPRSAPIRTALAVSCGKSPR